MKPSERNLFMRTAICLLAALVVFGVLLANLRGANQAEAGSHGPELQYLKAVNSVAPPRDPQLLFLLTGQYSNANLQGEGAEFFSARFKEFGPRLTDAQKALYLSAMGLLRAQHAPAVTLLHRVGYVKDTIAILEQAKKLSGGQIFVVNWVAGIVRAEVPTVFHQRKVAAAELAWCAENADKAPHPGWLREVYYHLGKVALAEGEEAKAQDYLRRSGYANFDRPITLITPFSEEWASGHAFSPRRIAEILPGRVFVLSGFEFTEYYFVVSDDRRELIGIDAGTRPDSAKAAYEALRAYAPDLPELTTVFITHSHWDHVGGHAYFRGLNPRLRFYARSNYHEEITREVEAPGIFDKRFFGERFSLEDVRSFKPDVAIDRRTELKIGGTRIELIPVQGGETQDAMFIHLPDQGVIFVRDFIMPYIGAPFGNTCSRSHTKSVFSCASMEEEAKFRVSGSWPCSRCWGCFCTTTSIASSSPCRSPSSTSPRVYQPYLILREHVIDRLYDQNIGYWQPDLQGLDHLTRADRAELLVEYLGLSERQLVKAVERLAEDGKYELAASLLESSGSRFEHSTSVAHAKRLVYLKLMEKHQNTDPFKFIIYSAKIAEQTPQMSSGTR
jgi:glyoxylase-like metal-dependent hydrolase (beta-lactamase superfamily II)